MDANLEVMEADTLYNARQATLCFLTIFKSGEGVDQIAKFVIKKSGSAKESDILIR